MGCGRRKWCRGRDSNPHALGAADFESAVSAISPPRLKDGAGEGNRTLVASLEGWSSAIELHPRSGKIYRGARGRMIADPRAESQYFFAKNFIKAVAGSAPPWRLGRVGGRKFAHCRGDARELLGGDDVGRHGVEQAAEGAEPDTALDEEALGAGHLQGLFELDNANGA